MKKRKKMLFKPVAAYVLSGALVLCVAVFSFLFVFIASSGEIAKGISVGEVNISGMTIPEAEIALSKTDSLLEREFVIYTKGGKTTSFKGSDIMLERSSEKTALRAYLVGRGGNIFENAVRLLRLYFVPENIGYVCTYDREKLAEILYNLGVSANGERKDYILEFRDDVVNVKRGVSGQSRNLDNAFADFDYAVGKGIYNICVGLNREMPQKPDTLSLYNETYISPQDARYEIKGNKVILIPEVVGRQIDIAEAEKQIERLSVGDTVTLSLAPIAPEVTLEILNRNLFNYTLGTYSTSYAASSSGRKANVELAARKINGMILAPGEVFSFNKTVGPRTRAAGFRDAPVYQNGETIEGVGGGVCQVSSTLYCAVLYADLKIVKRQNHSMTVAYVPKGQDATVAYGTIDFKFENNTSYPIKLSATYSGGKLTVSIFGTRPEKEKTVKIVNNIIETKAVVVEEVPDATLMVGSKKTASQGKTGYTVDTARIVLENGVEVKRESIGRSRYKMVPAKVLVGVKPAKEENALPETPAVETAEPTEDEAEEAVETMATQDEEPKTQEEPKTESD